MGRANQQTVNEVKQAETATQTRKDQVTLATGTLKARQPMSKPDVAERSQKESPPPRSVGGRKFNRQGNVWVDVKFKSSMSVKTVSRGSDDFAALDSGLRSIAQQLGGEVVVVWKGKAYRIR